MPNHRSVLGVVPCRSRHLAAFALAAMAAGVPAGAQQLPVQQVVLDNGMKILLVPRKGEPTVAAGWVAKVGSVNERPGITGVSHLFEHMMFKGTRTIGTHDITRELKLMADLDAVKGRLRVLEQELARRVRLGEVGDATDPAARTPEHRQLLDQAAALEKQLGELTVKNEFDQIYTAAGASGMNAFTTEDLTAYFITVPSNKLELWFWMESDRLLNPVFREFYSERDVVREERRMRTESTPTGKYDEQFESLFWNSSPYGWPVVGWPSDVEAITRAEAQAYFDVYYAPNNITLCLVGDFDAGAARALAARYFGRLTRNPVAPAPIRTREVPPLGARRFIATAETNPQVEIRYLTVADGHRDEPALVVASALLSGRTGRLYRSLVLDQKIASTAGAGQSGMKWEGSFSFSAVARPGSAPEQVEQALYREIETLQTVPVEARELQKVKNRFAADTYRRLQNNNSLMLQLLEAEGLRGWESFNEDPARIAAVTAEDVRRVATQYFKADGRAVAIYYTKKAEPGEAPTVLTDGLNPEEQAQVRRLQDVIAQASVEQAREMLAQVEQQAAAAPPEKQKMLAAVRTLLQQRIEKGGAR